MHIERGSTWNRWDFHVHTPYSILNNQFGFDPDPDWKSDVDKFDEYVKKLFQKAVEKGIVAIGITDYFSIDGYKRIRQAYLDKQEKMKELFPDDEFRSRVEHIYVFPNIELRLDTFVGDDNHSVNYHVIFSGDIECGFIEERFLQRLTFIHHTGAVLPINRASIKQVGREYKQNNPKETRDDYLVGLEKAAVHHDKVINVLKESIDLTDKFFLSIPVDEDLSTLKWDGRYSETRRLLYHQCHFLMSSNAGTRKFALAEGHEEEQKREFGSIKPCIWGSDAHSYDRMFCPDENRFCWIKAEPSYEGLQQIIYEPAERVRIQNNKPEEKDEHQLIDYISFDDINFTREPIYFSEGLNCIIGGKSTGKSILLRHIAKAVDPKIVAKRENETGLKRCLDVSASVTWKDGESGERKIVYIPQSWLNRTVDSRGESSEINSLIQEVLLQDEYISKAYRELMNGTANILESVKHDIISYVTAINNVAEREQQLKTEGRSKSFVKPISDLEKKRNELTETVGITQEDISRYS
ncbi:MAG: hypothetical protein Q4D71_09035, partial [Oscillospiraceae bacterium]|nr:hypothetical protein [Oscillospiraceae bacterium]